MDELDVLLDDFYGKYTQEQLTPEKRSQIKSTYQGDTDTLIKDLYGKYTGQTVDDQKLNTIKSTYFTQPQQTQILQPPKGGVATENGGLGSPVAPTDSSLESPQPVVEKKQEDKLDNPVLRVSYPELYAERDDLKAQIESRRMVGDTNPKELLSKLEELDSRLLDLSGGTSSQYSRLKDDLSNVDSQIAELENRAINIIKDPAYLEGDGTYQALLKQRQQLSAEIEPEQKALDKLSEDTNSNVGFSSFVSTTARLFGYREKADETVDLDPMVQENIMFKLDQNPRLKQKISGGHASLQEKEDLITSAKSDVIKGEITGIKNELEEINGAVLTKEQKSKAREKLANRYDQVVAAVGYDQATNIIKDTFKKTTESKEFEGMFGDGNFLTDTADATTTFLNGMIRTGLKGTLGYFTELTVGSADVITDQDDYSSYDAFIDTVDQWTDFNFLPDSKAPGTRVVDEEGEFNINYKTVTKSLANTLPFTLHLINDVKKGKIKNLEASLGKLLKPGKDPLVSNSLRMTESAFRHTLSDNIQEGRDAGLDDNKARLFGGTISLAEGLAEQIMPDTKFFGGTVGKGLLNNFKGSLKSAATKSAVKTAVKNFSKNMVLEIGEEEVVAAITDATKFAMIVGHENSEFLDWKRQKELVASAIIMSGALGAVNLKGDFAANRKAIYDNINNDINGVRSLLEDELTIENLPQEHRDQIESARKWVNDLSEAANTSPKNVTADQLDLLMDKNKLVKEMKGLDPAFHPAIKDKIEKIDNQILTQKPKEDAKVEVQDVKAEKQEVGDIQEVKGDQEITPQKDVKQSYVKAAETIRKAKFYKTVPEAMSKLQSDPTGLLKGGWDSAVEVVATTVELTGDINQAVVDGVAKLKESEWYQNLSAKGKKQAEEIFKGTITENISSQKILQKPQEVKPQVRKATGQKDTSKKVTISEKNLLREKFKNLQRGYKQGVKETKEFKSGFIKQVNRVVKDLGDNLTKREVQSILSKVNQISPKNIDKIDAIVEDLGRRVNTRGKVKQVTSVARKAKRAGKNKPLNIRNVSEDFAKIDFKNLSEKSLDKAIELAETIRNATLPATSKKFNIGQTDKMLKETQKLLEESDRNRLGRLADEVGLDIEGITTEELSDIFKETDQEKADRLLESHKKKQEIKKGMQRASNNLQRALATVPKKDLSDRQKRILKDLHDADVDLFSSAELRDFLIVGNNILTNNDFSRAMNISGTARAYTNTKVLKDTKGLQKSINLVKSNKILNFKDFSLILKDMFGSTASAAKFNLYSGYFDLSKNYELHKKAVSEVENSEIEVYKKALKKNKKINRAEFKIAKTIYAGLIQAETKEDMEINRARIETTIENLSKSYKTRRQAEVWQEVYNKVKDIKTQEEVKDYVKNLNDGTWDGIKFWIDVFESNKDNLRDTTEEVYGERMGEYVKNYTPIGVKYISKEEVKEDIQRPAFYGQAAPLKQATSTLSRVKSKVLPKGYILNGDFDAVMVSKYARVSYDIHVAESAKNVSRFLENPAAKEMLGVDNLSVLENSFERMMRIQRGVSKFDTDDISKAALEVSSTVKRIAATQALGGIDAYPKQYVGVVTNAFARLGPKNINNLFGSMREVYGESVPIVDEMFLYRRGELEGGIRQQYERLSAVEKRSTGRMVEKVSKIVKVPAKKASELWFTSLRQGDVHAAKATWLAYYKTYLTNKDPNKYNFDRIDIREEHLKLEEDPVRKEAAAWAQQNVEETQIATDESRESLVYSKEASTLVKVAKDVVFPYSRFVIQAKVRMMIDLKNMRRAQKAGDKEARDAAMRSFGGTISEQVVFHSVAHFALKYMLHSAKNVILDLLYDDEEEAEVIKGYDWGFAFKQVYSKLFNDTNPLAVGTIGETFFIEMANKIAYLADRQDFNSQVEYEKALRAADKDKFLYRYGDKYGFDIDGGDFGVYQGILDILPEVVNSFDYAFSDDPKLANPYGGRESNLNFTDKEKGFMKLMFGLELLYTSGMMEATTYRTNKKVQREVLKKAKKRKGKTKIKEGPL